MKKKIILSLFAGLLAGMAIGVLAYPKDSHKDEIIAIQSDIIRCSADWFGDGVYDIAQDYLSAIGEDTSFLFEHSYCY